MKKKNIILTIFGLMLAASAARAEDIKVDFDGKKGAIEMRKRFFDGFSFYIQEPGIYLVIDKNAINGDVDTKVYPKQVVAAITALVMAIQQEAPGRQDPQNPMD